MRYHVLASDYDGTLAQDGRVDDETLAALEKFRASGRRLILVTGRELEDLFRVFPHTDLFERIVAENGALLYRREKKEEVLLGQPPPADFVSTLRKRNVNPLSVGRVIVATWHPNETVVLETIRDLGLELQVVFNKGAVMVLPSGINKASGLKAALDDLGISRHNTAGIGDAENDHAFLELCECSAVVSNGLPALKERADLVTESDHGQGVAELVEMMISSDLAQLASRRSGHHIVAGSTPENGAEVRIRSYGPNLLLAGTSGSGKTTVATALLEQLLEQQYQCCIVDPEGDYAELENVLVIGTPKRAPTISEIFEVLEKPEQSLVANLLAVPLQDRPRFFASLLPRVQELRSQTGHPHVLVIDEAHHLLPLAWEHGATIVPRELQGLIIMTVEPDHIVPSVLKLLDTLLVVGEGARNTVRKFFEATSRDISAIPPEPLQTGEALFWSQDQRDAPVKIRAASPSSEHRRHSRKYSEGKLGPDTSFYFRGPEGRLNLRAENLISFVQIAGGIDDETWLYHFKRNDYSTWFRDIIKDSGLAEETRQIEMLETINPDESRNMVRAGIERRYTLAS